MYARVCVCECVVLCACVRKSGCTNESVGFKLGALSCGRMTLEAGGKIRLVVSSAGKASASRS